MHARRYWITWGLVLAVTCVAGCRGSRPLSRWVTVTHEPSESDDLQAPKQRLATAKPRVEVTMTAEASGKDRSPHVSNVAAQNATKPNANNPSTTTTALDSVRARLAATDRKTDSTSAKTQSEPIETNALSIYPEDLMDAFSKYPPEVQEQALRQLTAAMSREATSTTQPESLNVALKKTLADLPTLPDAKNEKPEVAPQRLASTKSENRTNATISDQIESTTSSQPRTQSLASGVKAGVSHLESTDVQPIATQSTKASEVRPASAARSKDDASMVARAIIEPPAAATSVSTDYDQLSIQAHYDVLEQRLTQPVVGESEADRNRRLISERVIKVLSGDPDGAVEKIDGMAEKDQEFLRHLLLGLWTVTDPEGHPVMARRFTSALPEFREATRYLAAATDSLDVRSLAFCTEIESYGQIKTFPGNSFDAGQQVILYCEIENFTVDKSKDGFVTHLQGSYDIYNADNQKVVSQLLPADKQTSNNYLRDYFIAYQMHLPQELAAGTYRLQLTMEDVGGKKYGQAEIPFEIKK